MRRSGASGVTVAIQHGVDMQEKAKGRLPTCPTPSVIRWYRLDIGPLLADLTTLDAAPPSDDGRALG